MPLLTDSQRLMLCGEPTIDQLLADPIIQQVMRRDGIDETVVMTFVNDARARLGCDTEPTKSPRAA
ncbi:MAG: hypothetical protein AAF563_07920 [Pseudomonadota bacterium]